MLLKRGSDNIILFIVLDLSVVKEVMLSSQSDCRESNKVFAEKGSIAPDPPVTFRQNIITSNKI